MNSSACPAARLHEVDRKDLAILALAGTATISDLAARHGVSRKFVHRQADKASVALHEVFASATPDDEVLLTLPVTRTWLRQLTLGLTLICHSSYRGVVELMRDLLGVSISEGTVHNVHQAAAQQAGTINRSQDLSAIRVGLHDEIFQGSQPVLAGVDARSTYCYLLAAAKHRDADIWGIHLLDASRQGLNPDYTIADAGQGLRSGEKAAWSDKPVTVTCSTSRTSAKCWPTPWPASPVAPGRDARSYRQGAGKHAKMRALPAGSCSPAMPRHARMRLPATSGRSPHG
jgi:hypothetical protein